VKNSATMAGSIMRRHAAAFLCAAFLAGPVAETLAAEREVAPAPIGPPRPLPAPVTERWIFAKLGTLVVGYNEETRFALDGEVFAHAIVRLSRRGAMSGITYQFALFKGTYNCAARTYQRQSLEVFDLQGVSVGAGADVDQAGRPIEDDPVQKLLMGVLCGETPLANAQEAASFPAMIEAANRLTAQ